MQLGMDKVFGMSFALFVCGSEWAAFLDLRSLCSKHEVCGIEQPEWVPSGLDRVWPSKRVVMP